MLPSTYRLWYKPVSGAVFETIRTKSAFIIEVDTVKRNKLESKLYFLQRKIYRITDNGDFSNSYNVFIHSICNM